MPSGICYDGQVQEVPERIELRVFKDHFFGDLQILTNSEGL